MDAVLKMSDPKRLTLKMLIDAGKQSGESSLTIHDIATKVKNAHNV